jgi:hypothetical protein
VEHDRARARARMRLRIRARNRSNSELGMQSRARAGIPSGRLLVPAAMVTEERGTFKKSEKNRMQASLARPSVGGAVSSSFKLSPTCPQMRSRLPRGCTFTANDTPSAVSVVLINDQLRCPKIAAPMRIQVEPSSMATSKSCDMPMESSFISTAGRCRAAILSRNSRKRRK